MLYEGHFLFLLLFNTVTNQCQHILHRKRHIIILVLLLYLANLEEFESLQRGKDQHL